MLTKESQVEYEKWLNVVKELNAINVDINRHDKLHQAIKDWSIAFHEFKKERGE